MKKAVALLAIALALSMALTDAHAKRKGKKKYRAKPAVTVESVAVEYTSRSTGGWLDNSTLCDGGVMITADDQIKGCTTLINSRRLNRERKATALYNRGNAYVGKSDFARAIADYTDALNYRRDYAQAFFNRAVAHRISGNTQFAVTDYSSAIALSPNDPDAFAGRGTAYARLGQNEKAAADFEQAIKLKPDHLGALTQRGHHYLRMQQWPLAIADYAAALSLQATNVEALYGRGVAKVYSGDIRGGQADMAQAQAIDSGVTGRMTAQGVPPPQIFETAPPIERKDKPKPEPEAAPSQQPPPEPPKVSDSRDALDELAGGAKPTGTP